MIKKQKDLISSWLYLTQFYGTISKDLESALKEKHQIALKEFYVLLFLSEVPDKQLPLQELQRKVGLSQSAMSRLAARMESKSCGVIRRYGYGDDKRGVYTVMTDKGQHFLEEVMETVEKTMGKAIEQWDINFNLTSLLNILNKKLEDSHNS